LSDDFRKNLRSELDFQDITVKELSVRTGIPKTSLECYLRTKANMPAADVAVKIAKALGVSVEYLVTGGSPEQSRPSAGPAQNPKFAGIIQKIEKMPAVKQEALEQLVNVM